MAPPQSAGQSGVWTPRRFPNEQSRAPGACKLSPLASIPSSATAKEAILNTASGELVTPQSRATISRNRWARISRNQWATIFRNRGATSSRNGCAASLGISILGEAEFEINFLVGEPILPLGFLINRAVDSGVDR